MGVSEETDARFLTGPRQSHASTVNVCIISQHQAGAHRASGQKQNLSE